MGEHAESRRQKKMMNAECGIMNEKLEEEGLLLFAFIIHRSSFIALWLSTAH
jgi:hypothetical protein